MQLGVGDEEVDGQADERILLIVPYRPAAMRSQACAATGLKGWGNLLRAQKARNSRSARPAACGLRPPTGEHRRGVQSAAGRQFAHVGGDDRLVWPPAERRLTAGGGVVSPSAPISDGGIAHGRNIPPVGDSRGERFRWRPAAEAT